MQLNIDQKRIIETKPNGHMLIKGVAGSGKTTVAVNKIPHLIKHYCSNEDKVLVITYAKTLINYIRYIYEDMDDEITTIELLDNKTSSKVKISTVDSIIYKLFNEYQKFVNKRYHIIGDTDRYRIINKAISTIEKRYSNQNIVTTDNARFLLEEFDWIKSCKYLNIETYQSIDRKGRTNNNETDGPQRILKNSINRRAIYELMIEYEKLMEKEGLTDFKTMAIRVLKGLKCNKIKCEKYPHILIDESQDLTRVQLEILYELYNHRKIYSSIVFVADTAQSIYPHSWLSYNSFKSIGFDMSGRARILSKNYRTTTEIARAAYSLIENDENVTSNINYVKPSVIDRHGKYPLYRHFSSEVKELDYISNEINNKLYKKFNLKDVAIIARKKAQLYNAKNFLISRGIDAEIIDKKNPNFDNDSVKLITMHSIKGLEFNVVIIIGLNKDNIPIKVQGELQNNKDVESVERKLLYVGMTRAKEVLYLTSSYLPSKFIAEINPAYLLLEEDQEFKRVRHIGIENYRYTEKIADKYSNEEIVRQWVINELNEKLDYPYEMIDMEYKVKTFSRTGYVDIVVFNYNQGKKEPYIFCEIKRPNEDINNAILQLKSYLETNENVKYGLACNGKDILIIKRDKGKFQYMDRLPKFSGNIGQIVSEYKYIDIRKGKKYKLLKNVEDNEVINLYDYDSDIAYDIEKYDKLNIYGKVIAGNFQLAVQENLGYISLPSNLLYDSNNCFLLEVTGDSMINAGINKGDYVIVHKQNYAENLDIIVGVVGNEATLKKYTTMGNKVLLMPENKKYEPIIVEEIELHINGKVIGILKRD
ncbi:UvrD-helicase domain-containing protein [Vallitalea guaymasensis]|uniref:DNA 3'-5' helicase n=1 Tax=Vallitalea guaymasensis TaxID=1185412 RepID=A0A8J8M8B2_9FIRM|nr:UvrD-helicase domain-containing protein [Vallitalea guaymasensis]QUH28063.1 UvrD-helicase domain-containing protein [Vallitalea guaymasensis]